MENKKLVILIIISIIIITGIAFSLTYQPENSHRISDSGIKNDLKPDNQIKNIKLTLFNSDRSISWQMESDEIKNYREDALLELKPIQISANKERDQNYDEGEYNKNGKNIIYTIMAKESIYQTTSGKININGPVRINKDKFALTSGQLTWQDGEDNIYGQEGVSISSPFFIINGEEFIADIALKKLTISGDEDEQVFLKWSSED